ncbi:hypothetical protein IMZ08_02030 [Bacillus luteolus]|uniref:Uncharacterized protein n=1 Tax=Litchfieldia luteola TaxID=682179 RepID=A0ABR9QEB3_9BACI|nr:hypothetical protein [Cytobacillus luteolus]MBE4906836.1 hypothetical protein [Cytobacillus luteolus]MBP1940510.1 hypothetical protein [Cytobacillus luteolus]
MKRWRIISSLCLFVIITVFSLRHIYISNVNKFDIAGSSWFDKDLIQLNETYYFGHHLLWEGDFKPTILAIDFLKTDGFFLEDNDPHVSIEPLVDPSQIIGVLPEEAVKEHGDNIQLHSVKNYKMSGDILELVLKGKVKSEGYKDNFQQMRITYKIFGITHEQYLEFNGIVE